MRPASSATAALLLTAFLLGAPVPAAGGADAPVVLQAPESNQGLAIVARQRRASVIVGSRAAGSVRLRKGERLEAVAEVEEGFVTAGVGEGTSGEHLVLFLGRRAGIRRLPSPPSAESLQLRPVLLVEEGDLTGAAWLEGPDPGSLRVKTSDWDGAGWGPVYTVSLPSEGSQTGLAGTVLADGTELLVWSQFDGQDDELFFSWREKSTWSTPARLAGNNNRPDISPALIATERGALVSWSRFDGADYRLWTAIFERGSWGRVRQAGAAGSLYPELLNRGSNIYAIVRRAAPRGWSVRRFSPQGESESVTFFAVAESERPLLLRYEANSVTLGWPQSGRTVEGRLERGP